MIIFTLKHIKLTHTHTHTHTHTSTYAYTHRQKHMYTILPFHFQVSWVRQFGYQELKAEHLVLYTRYAITILMKDAPYQFI